jgi:diguanylate cyclase (GGDEF)-like protein
MGLVWHSADTDEESRIRGLFYAARRAMLVALVLSGLLLMPLVAARGRMAWGMATIFLWSLVVLAYVGQLFMRSRRYYRRKSSELGVTDVLTGLPNRKGLMAALDRFNRDPQDFGRRIRLIDVDLVNLDRVNYEFGQLVGDAVLQDIAGLLHSQSPESCVVGRLGGDEFLVIMPAATVEEAQALAQSLSKAVADYKLNLGERGEVTGMKARASVADYAPENASLHETVTSAKEASSHGDLLAETGAGAVPSYHIPRVTLGAFAVHRWQNLSKGKQEEFKLWKREPGNTVPSEYLDDTMRLLDEKAEMNWVDFVTAVPAPGPGGATRVTSARLLGEALAKQIGVPFRDVMRADASGPESRSVEPAVDAVIDKGDSVLLVSDVVSSGIVERRCVKKLSAAGAHVQVVAWVAY